MEGPNTSKFISIAVFAGIGAIVLFLVCRPVDPNTELARTARAAVQLARDAGSSTESAVLLAGRFRLLAVVVGVTAPLIVVYLIWRSSTQSDLDPAELIEAAERYRLFEQPGNAPEQLPGAASDALPSRNADDPTD